MAKKYIFWPNGSCTSESGEMLHPTEDFTPLMLEKLDTDYAYYYDCSFQRVKVREGKVGGACRSPRPAETESAELVGVRGPLKRFDVAVRLSVETEHLRSVSELKDGKLT
ncbi:unnamed protein product, partial [Mesorhabditis belari]|uniref:Uncharacterized protein n=1 Tax=Mesorhabditis belari TaxID=2138241 RepID=A0AAF3ETY2_9BILA